MQPLSEPPIQTTGLAFNGGVPRGGGAFQNFFENDSSPGRPEAAGAAGGIAQLALFPGNGFIT